MPTAIASRAPANTRQRDVATAIREVQRQLADNKRILDQNNKNIRNIIAFLFRKNLQLTDETSAAFNILEDFDEEKLTLAAAEHAMLNILEDFDLEKQALASGMTAAFNILEDLHTDNAWLQQSQSAMVNLLEDLDQERSYAAAAGAALARASALRAEIAERHARETERLNQALFATNTELEAFSYSVSHDLRTPLRAIDGFSRILLEDYGDKLDDEGKRVINVVRDSTVKMARLIDDILAFSRAGRAEMNAATVDMEALVRSLLADPLALNLVGRTPAIDLGKLPPAEGDRAMFERVWINLLDNAIKFTAPKSDARIEIGATISNGETVYHVRDNGVGFDMQYAGKLFGVFQRLHGTEIPGTGIGLAIVKRLVTRHGGRVWAEGKVGGGASFYFALPNKEADHASRQ